ncbi:peptidylprolyl isomerase [uncultured Nisaea sp.]|jgi:peptidyl-prolyl cis-trans isomerase C|uniref:peptidylprolyl isomerase n=1 Tax=uncultured Nisaea sp. TaxID=538215 RepID=UPI0030EEE7C6|tara:strand:- start:345 stop:1274 length:930 start_codon:yes stop_codon:yes gene_type:complete
MKHSRFRPELCVPALRVSLTAMLPVLALGMTLALPAAAQTTSATPETKPAAQAAIDPATTVVATVDGEKIYLSEILLQIQQLPQQYQQAPMEQIYPPMLDRVIDSRLIAKAAREAGIQDRADVKERVEQAESGIISEVYMTEKVKETVGEDALRKRYEESIKDSAEQGEEVKARHILVASEEDAKAIIEELKKGADFAKLAAEKSTGPSGTSGGDLGYFTADAMVPEFSEAAFALKPGEITEAPVQTQFGWHVIKVEDRRAVQPPSFEQMQPQLAQEMTREILTKAIEELRAGVDIKRYGPDGSALQTK